MEGVRCRICLDDSVPKGLVRPCSCRGTAAYVHETCLKQWIRSYLQTSTRVPACEVCAKPYTIQYSRPHNGIALFLMSPETPPLLLAVYAAIVYTLSAALFIAADDVLSKTVAGFASLCVLLLGLQWRSRCDSLRRPFVSTPTAIYTFALLSQGLGYAFLYLQYMRDPSSPPSFLDYQFNSSSFSAESMELEFGKSRWTVLTWKNSGVLMMSTALWINVVAHFCSVSYVVLSNLVGFCWLLIQNFGQVQNVWIGTTDELRATFILVVHSVCIGALWLVPCDYKPPFLAFDVVFLILMQVLVSSRMSHFLDVTGCRFAVFTSLFYICIVGAGILFAYLCPPSDPSTCIIWGSCDWHDEHPLLQSPNGSGIFCCLHQDMFVALHGWGFTLFALPVGVLYGLYSYVMTLKRSYDTWRSETHEEVASVESGEVEDQEAVTGQGANPPPAAASLSTFLSSRQCPTWLMAAQFAWGYTAEVVLIFFALYLYQDGGDSKLYGQAEFAIVGAFMLLFLSLGLGYIWVLSRTDALEEEAVRERKKYRYVRFVLKWFTVYALLLLLGVVLVWKFDLYISHTSNQRKLRMRKGFEVMDDKVPWLVRWNSFCTRLQFANSWVAGIFLTVFLVSVTIAKLRKSYVVWLQTGGGEIRILEPDMGIRVEHERLDE